MVSTYTMSVDDELFWIWRLKRGKVEPPEPAHVPVEEKYDRNALKNILREWYGRHSCPACGKSFFFIHSAFNCHPKASAYKVWEEFAHKGPAGATSLSDLVRADVCNPYSGGGYYGGGGPYGF